MTDVVTVSLGVLTATDLGQLQTLVEAADECLYRAKREGRNRAATGVLP